jgi:hypothetical protein
MERVVTVTDWIDFHRLPDQTEPQTLMQTVV